MVKNKSRYKPFYKKFIRLRKNVQNKKKVSLGFFKKKKMENSKQVFTNTDFKKKKKF